MAAKINKKYTIAAQGVLHIDGDMVAIENEDTGALIQLSELYEDFNEKECKLTIAYGEDIE